MCGIVAGCAQRDITEILLAGLYALEYRGYDSAGMAILDADNVLQQRRTAGKVAALEQIIRQQPLSGQTGIAHTRWATHGRPLTHNAHPHYIDEHLAIVHNGIIENYSALRRVLEQSGCRLQSETDTEIIGCLIAARMDAGDDLLAAVRGVLPQLQGSYALAVMSTREPGVIVGARHGPPLLIGVGFGEHYLSSDVHTLLPVTNRIVHLDDGDVVRIDHAGWQVSNVAGELQSREIYTSELSLANTERGSYRHFMQKEIFEQPDALSRTLDGRISDDHLLPGLLGLDADALLARVDNVHIVACGTSYHAGLVARYQIEQLAGISCTAEVASEYRYRSPVVPPNCLFVAISQSGETADTLAALAQASKAGYLATVAICNVPESSLVRAADLLMMTRAGPEIGVASTKAFTTQLVALQLLQLAIMQARGDRADTLPALVADLRRLPDLVQRALQLDDQVEAMAEAFAERQHSLFLGRGNHYPVAMEGALKLKEISYIHAEAYPAGELKHGPLALVDADMPVVAVAPNNHLLGKLVSNLEEVHVRGGQLFVIADHHISDNISSHARVLEVETGSDWLAPVVLTIPLQLLAYHVALLKGTDVDQPRNLAKSVTVE
ncbi:MAG: glutamine--fructose-6-phosphate transaminase (isomerizing) [Gammaproteobacteria bacterium]|nr:glutamine--fructose-6-phosphate transaminase (isomerizing) [Gammaproteobacteria bacterium]